MRQEKLCSHGNIAMANLPTLGIVAGQQFRSAPTLHHRGELPAEINRIAEAGVHAERAGRRQLVHGIAREQHAAACRNVRPPALRRVQRMTRAGPIRPRSGAADRAGAPSPRVIDFVEASAPTGIERHDPP